MQSLRHSRHPHSRRFALQEGTSCPRQSRGFRSRQNRRLVSAQNGRHTRAPRRARHQRRQAGACRAESRQETRHVPRGHEKPRRHQGNVAFQARCGALCDQGAEAHSAHGLLPYAQGNWLYIGEPIYLDEFYGSRRPEDFERATEVVYEAMQKTREECDAYVEGLLAAKKSRRKRKGKSE